MSSTLLWLALAIKAKGVFASRFSFSSRDQRVLLNLDFGSDSQPPPYYEIPLKPARR